MLSRGMWTGTWGVWIYIISVSTLKAKRWTLIFEVFVEKLLFSKIKVHGSTTWVEPGAIVPTFYFWMLHDTFGAHQTLIAGGISLCSALKAFSFIWMTSKNPIKQIREIFSTMKLTNNDIRLEAIKLCISSEEITVQHKIMAGPNPLDWKSHFLHNQVSFEDNSVVRHLLGNVTNHHPLYMAKLILWAWRGENFIFKRVGSTHV